MCHLVHICHAFMNTYVLEQILQSCIHSTFIDYNVSLFAFIKRAALYCDESSEVLVKQLCE